MNLLEQLRGNFPKTIDKSKPVFSWLIANENKTGRIQQQLEYLIAYMKEWISTPDVYKQTGVMLDKTIKFFSFLERFADETEQSLKNRFGAIFIRNHDTRWGTAFDVKSVFKQYFPHATIYLVENTNKINDASPEYANLFVNGDINTDNPTDWNPVDCSATTAARFSKSYGMELDQAGGNFSQTVTVLNRKRINDTEPYEYKNLTYFLHFFMSGVCDVQIYNAANTKYWDNNSKSWSSSPVQNRFETSEWNNCSLFFITEGNDDNADITVKFTYVGTPIHTELSKTVLDGVWPVEWTLTDCTETDNVISLLQSGAKVSSTLNPIPENSYNLKFSSKGRLAIIVSKEASDNVTLYWDFTNQEWTLKNPDEDSDVYISVSNFVQSADWTDKTLSLTTETGDTDINISFNYVNSNAYLRNISFSGLLVTDETLTDCVKQYGVVNMDQMTSDASYTTDVKPEHTYNLKCNFKGRTAIIIQNDNNKYWDVKAHKWRETIVANDYFADNTKEESLEILADANTTELTISFNLPHSYLDYFRLFEKQPYSSFTVIAYFEGNTSVGVFGLAAGDADPNIETAEETPPQPRYGNYGYYDKSFLSGVPIGFASDIYEDLLDYLRAQGVRAYLDFIIKEYSENE